MWLNEGWASYSEAIFKEKIYGYSAFNSYVKNNHKNVLNQAHIDDGGYLSLINVPHEYTYGTTVYYKGADVANTLRTYLGDNLFFSGIQNYLNTFQYSDASSYDFRDNLSSFTGVDLTDFFDGWVFQEGFPHFSVDSFTVNNIGAGNYEVEVFMKQKKATNPNLINSNRIPVSFIKDDWTSIDTLVHFDGATGSEIFTIAFNPIGVWCDKEAMISDATLDDYLVIKDATGIILNYSNFTIVTSSIGDSVLLRVEHNLAAPDGFKTQIPGLVISKEHYWRIDGDIDNDFISQAKFDYKASLHDSILMKNNYGDSLVLLYRVDRAHDWEITSFTKNGVDFFGSLKKDTFQLGEYCFGIWDWETYVNINEPNKTTKSELKIYPNPTSGIFSIENKEIDSIVVFDIKGNTIKQINNIDNNSNIIKIDISKEKKGIYFVKANISGKNIIGKIIKD
jgi:aminopeptidase N